MEAYPIMNHDIQIIRVKFIDNDLYREGLNQVSDDKNWIDLRVAEDIDMKKGEFKLINLGVAMELPKGYEAHLIPRSSTYKNFHIIQVNSIGIIDRSYSGDNDWWLFAALAIENTHIPRGSRIAQFRIIPIQNILTFEYVDELGNKDRGGIGSTGIM